MKRRPHHAFETHTTPPGHMSSSLRSSTVHRSASGFLGASSLPICIAAGVKSPNSSRCQADIHAMCIVVSDPMTRQSSSTCPESSTVVHALGGPLMKDRPVHFLACSWQIQEAHGLASLHTRSVSPGGTYFPPLQRKRTRGLNSPDDLKTLRG